MPGLHLMTLALCSARQINEWSRTRGGDFGLRRIVVVLSASLCFRGYPREIRS